MSPAAPPDPGVSVAGPEAAPAVVFLHGTRLTRGAWAAQVDALAVDHRVITTDLPGHGTRAAQPFSLDGAAAVVADVIRSQASDSRAVVVGLSLGGYVGMELAASEPDLVRGLVLAGATAEPCGARSVPFRVLAEILERFEGPALQRFNAWFFRTRYPASIAEPIVAGGFWSAGGAAGVRCLIGERFLPRLAAYPGPTLIINGEWDLLFRLSAPDFARVAQDARRVRLPGALHLSNLDRPAAFTEAVYRFVSSLDGVA